MGAKEAEAEARRKLGYTQDEAGNWLAPKEANGYQPVRVKSARDLLNNVTGGTPILPSSLQEVKDYWGGSDEKKPEEESSDPDFSPGYGTHYESLDQGNQGASDVANSERILLGGGMQQPSAFYTKEGTQTASVGGPGVVDAALVSGPRALENAYKLAGKAKEERADALSKHYDQVAQDDAARAAAFAAKRQEDEQQIQQRQQKLEQATQYYSDDLADQGKFWRNPGNIISAISYSLLPIFGGDPTAGVKLVNQAVQQDIANRQHAAGETLGALRSNLDGYRKIAGDRQNGDLLAQAEAHRMVAQEAERIGQKFESAQSKAQLEALIQDNRQKAAMLFMQVHKNDLWVPPHKEDPGVFNARARGTPGAYAPMGQGDTPNPYRQVPGAPSTGEIAGTPSVASQKKNSGFTPDVRPATVAAIKVGGEKAAWAETLNGHIHGQGNLFNAADMSLNAQAAAASKGNPSEFMAKKAQIWKENLDKVAAAPEVLTKGAARNAALTMLQQKMEGAAKLEAAQGNNPDKFLDDAGAFVPRSWIQSYDAIARRWASDPATKSAQQAAARDAMRKSMRRDLASVYNSYVHDHAGGAVNETEREHMNNVINADKMSFGELHSFVQNQSNEANADYRANLDKLPVIARFIYTSQHGLGVQPLTNPGVRPAVQPPRPGYTGGMSNASSMQSKPEKNYSGGD